MTPGASGRVQALRSRVAGAPQVNDWSLLYTWKGTNSSLKPVLCISHLDVVPVTSEEAWTHAPFGGIVKDG